MQAYTLVSILTISCCTLLYLWLSNTPAAIPVHSESATFSVKTAKLTCKDSLLPLSVDAVLESPEVTKVAFSVAGKLEQGELRLDLGSSFHKGQLLYQINNKEAFAALNKVKTELASAVVRILPRIESEFPGEKNKWVRFMEELKPQFLVPELPVFKTSGERYLFMESGCADTYSRLQEMEVNMANYFYIAPFDGTIIAVHEQPGNQVSKGRTIVRIARSMPYHIKAQIRPEDAVFFRQQKADVTSAQGDHIGTATFESKATSVNNDGSVNFRFSFQPDRKRPLFHGMGIRLTLKNGKKVQVSEVPATAIRQGKVQVLTHKTIVEKPIDDLYNNSGKMGIKGIPCGAIYLTEFINNPQNQGRYVSAQ